MKIKDVVILVGGLGTRLGNLTKNIPKPLIMINKISFLDQLICKIIKYNFKNIFLLCSYKKEKFFIKYNNKYIHNTKIKCINEGKPKGTGGALFKLKNKIKNDFILLNGDTFFDIDYNSLISKKLKKKRIFMCITKKENTFNNEKLNNLSLRKEQIYFSKKSTNFTNGGIYLVKKNVLNKIENKYTSFEDDILKNEIINKRVIGKYFNRNFIDIGSKQKLKFIKKKPYIIQNKCFFLDRDGVVNKECGYVTKFKSLIFLKGVDTAIKYLNKKGYLVIIITNQAAIGKGLITELKLNKIHSKMINKLYKKNGAIIDDIFYAPYYKYSKKLKYRENLYDRKPNPGMFLKAKKKWNIDLSKSFYIGDKLSDKIAAKRIKVKFYYKDKFSLYRQIRNIIK